MKKVTIQDVAEKAGVSKGTVSAVINGKNSVKAVTRDHVLEVIKEMEFRPKGVARNLKYVNQGKTIGIILKDINYPFYNTIAKGAMAYAESKGYSLIVTSSEDSHESEKRLSHLFSTKDIGGAIIAPIVEGEAEIEHLFKLKMLNYPFVLLEDVKGIQANVVAIDNLNAVKEAVKYLIDHGHSRILHFAGPAHSSHTHERIDGFRHAFSESPLVFDEKAVIPIGTSDHEEVIKKTTEFFASLRKEDYPTAIVCFNDQQALGVITALTELDLRVPEDISVVGNDDINYSRLFPVPLTTIHAPQFEIGEKAAEILIRHIESQVQLPVEKVILGTEFIVRESTRVLSESQVEL
ncbi:MAG TPA: LacI family DNA-binding transcriptional regulator [Calditrichia bacterium]|nr:LacI family DNA-binding transcriptional regulator [Calditrichota bacterium]HQU74157.1 LacI family DNA-binding transcriptional regulator [Calditrichia bacterium]HQV31602.1 LacI family DNA-binding transcriptional regulator [Calditrichia bacterium]